MGRGHRLAVLLHSAAALILSNTHIGNSLGAARQRHDLFNAYAAGYSGDSTREAASALPYLIALATSANIGSAATLVGNPQNMIIGHFSHIPFSQFSRTLAPAAIIGLAINFIILCFGFRCALRSAVIEREAR